MLGGRERQPSGGPAAQAIGVRADGAPIDDGRVERAGRAPGALFGGAPAAGAAQGVGAGELGGAGRPRTATVPRQRSRACVARTRVAHRGRVRRTALRTPSDRLLTGVAVALCSAVVAVALGLVADLAASSHAAAPADPVAVSVEP